MEVITIVLWLVFTALLITKIRTFFAARVFLLQRCFLLLVILQALATLSWSHAVLPVLFPWVHLAVTGAVPAWSGLNLTVFCFSRWVFLWVWFVFMGGISCVWQQLLFFFFFFKSISENCFDTNGLPFCWDPLVLCIRIVSFCCSCEKPQGFASWETYFMPVY